MSQRSPGAPRRSVVWTARALAVLLSSVLGAGVAELLLRSDSILTGRMAPMRVDEDARSLPEIEGIYALARPNQRARYRGALYETNSRGVRGGEIPIEKTSGAFRIAVIGDSVTMGSGVRLEEAYPALIEESLRGTATSPRFEVLNFGLAGLSLEGSVTQRLLPVALDYSPDMLVYGFTINDLEGPDYVKLPRLPRQHGTSRLLDLLHERWDYLRDIVWPSPSSYVREVDVNFFENPTVWHRFEANLDRLAAVGRERGVCVVVLLHTQLSALHSWHPFLRHYEKVARAAESRGMYVAESFPWFEGVDPDDYTCGPYDSHPNAAGHQVLAEALLPALRALPPDCWDGSPARVR